MSSSSAFRRLWKDSRLLRQGVQQARQDILGHAPQLHMRTGRQATKKQLTGIYLNQYYIDPIDKVAKKVRKTIVNLTL